MARLDLHNSPEDLTPKKIAELVREVNTEWANLPSEYSNSGDTITELVLDDDIKKTFDKSDVKLDGVTVISQSERVAGES